MAKKIFCLKDHRKIFEDHCTAGRVIFAGTDKDAKTCFSCIRQRKEAEIRAEYPDKITEAQEHLSHNDLRFAKIESLLEGKKELLKKYGQDNEILPKCEPISLHGNEITPFLSADRINSHWRNVARNNFLYNLIEIDDHTKRRSQTKDYLQMIFANAGRGIPTVIEYVTHPGGKKPLAILIPEGLPFTTFLKEGQ